jgi:hypothetical protein
MNKKLIKKVELRKKEKTFKATYKVIDSKEAKMRIEKAFDILFSSQNLVL